MLLSNVNTNDTYKSHCVYKEIVYSLNVPLHWGAILTHASILRNTTEWLFLNLYYRKYELAPLLL